MMYDTKMTVWALFDSGNGSYTEGAATLNRSGGANIDMFPVGIDIEKKNNHFINLDLADYSRLFGNNTLFDELDKLPKPDLIIASPPCESWSNASAMSEGNACWKKEDISDSLFVPQRETSMFTIRSNSDYDKAFINYKYDRQFMKRVNGELTAFNEVSYLLGYDAYNTFSDLITKVNEWAISHGLDKSNPKIQWMKVTEEVGEIRDVFLKPHDFVNPEWSLKDAIGDSIVTLIVLSLQLGYDVEECLTIAYNDIKNRKGVMIDDNFVKEKTRESTGSSNSSIVDSTDN